MIWITFLLLATLPAILILIINNKVVSKFDFPGKLRTLYEGGTPFYEPVYEIIVPSSEDQLLGGVWMCAIELESMELRGGL